MDSTISHILTRLDEQDRTTARMHEENKTLLSELKTDFEKFGRDFGKRMTKVEKFCWGLAAVISLTGFCLGLYATFHAGH